ncbi:hypothetical protein V5799_007659 [Amblyomma americanum]|uniref:Uncharacterized protein n=1 Tax=Amblyomma americanum TaxID=6943 RepID=A0AAQ4FHC2_AMBAM
MTTRRSASATSRKISLRATEWMDGGSSSQRLSRRCLILDLSRSEESRLHRGFFLVVLHLTLQKALRQPLRRHLTRKRP